jgi:hypothetical protein
MTKEFSAPKPVRSWFVSLPAIRGDGMNKLRIIFRRLTPGGRRKLQVLARLAEATERR